MTEETGATGQSPGTEQSPEIIPEDQLTEDQARHADTQSAPLDSDDDWLRDSRDPEEDTEKPGETGKTGRNAKPQTWGDKIGPKKLGPRHEVLAYMAAAGASNKQIAKEIGLTQSRISVLLSNTKIKERIEQIRDEYYGENLKKRFERLGPQAMKVIEELIADPEETHDTRLKVENARWVLEKQTGRPTQPQQVESQTVSSLIELLSDMRRKGEIQDVTPQGGAQPIIEGSTEDPGGSGELASPAKPDKWAQWVQHHIPDAPKTKGRKNG